MEEKFKLGIKIMKDNGSKFQLVVDLDRYYLKGSLMA